jgi:dTMP kinase
MFITFEGIDFSGKSTQVELLRKYLLKQGRKVEIFREPGGTEISEIVRTILLDKNHNKMCMETEIFLFSASRAQLVREKIRPYLKKGIYVILDRFHDSTIAYQGFGRGIPLDSVMHINKLSIGEIIPDLTFFLDIPVKEAEKRKKLHNREELDRIEVSSTEFYDKVRKGYLYLAENESRFRVLNGALSIEDVNKKIIEEIVLFENKEKIC